MHPMQYKQYGTHTKINKSAQFGLFILSFKIYKCADTFFVYLKNKTRRYNHLISIYKLFYTFFKQWITIYAFWLFLNYNLLCLDAIGKNIFNAKFKLKKNQDTDTKFYFRFTLTTKRTKITLYFTNFVSASIAFSFLFFCSNSMIYD